jgi:hypothetical protein
VEYALTLEKLEADFYRRAVAATQGGALAGAPTVAKTALVGLCHRFGHLRPPMHSSPELLNSKTLFHKGYGFLGTKLA